jgi:hypothetical protein
VTFWLLFHGRFTVVNTFSLSLSRTIINPRWAKPFPAWQGFSPTVKAFPRS